MACCVLAKNIRTAHGSSFLRLSVFASSLKISLGMNSNNDFVEKIYLTLQFGVNKFIGQCISRWARNVANPSKDLIIRCWDLLTS